MIPIFYINLAARTDRMRFMEEQGQKLGLSFTRIEAATPADISETDAALYCDTAKRTYLRKNQLACTLSHERVWATFLEGGAPWCLVLEDDVWLSQRLAGFLPSVESIGAELIRIETTGSSTRVFPATHTTSDGTEIRPFRSTPMGSAAYLVSRRGVNKLLEHPALRQRPIDLVLNDPFEEPGKSIDRVLTIPAYAQQLGLIQPEQVAGRSDIVGGDVHHYAKQHPVLFRFYRSLESTRVGLRNATDHFRQTGKGLERVVVPLAE